MRHSTSTQMLSFTSLGGPCVSEVLVVAAGGAGGGTANNQ